jgi:hypothetical protein
MNKTQIPASMLERPSAATVKMGARAAPEFIGGDVESC